MTLNLTGIGMTSERTRLRLIDRLRQAGITDEKVLSAIKEIPRHYFIDEAISHRAYEDIALPIGYGQSISQPYIVAKMTSVLLAAEENCKNILEIGTGSGYQAAILAFLVEKVITIEIIESLHKQAKERFSKLKLRNIKAIKGDGNLGYASDAPFDAILVTAAPKEVPIQLLEQLKIGGRLIIPVGAQGAPQALKLITKQETGYNQFTLEMVNFVPLVDGEPKK